MNKEVAVKFFRSLKHESAKKEIELLFELRHPNIVGILGYFTSIKAGEQYARAGIVLEFCERGKLSDAYKKDWFAWAAALKVLAGSARAVGGLGAGRGVGVEGERRRERKKQRNKERLTTPLIHIPQTARIHALLSITNRTPRPHI